MSLCVCCLFVGVVPVVESPGSCRVGADSILVAYMAPPPKRRMRRRSCYRQLTEQVAERTAAGGGGVVFCTVLGGGGVKGLAQQIQKDDKAHLPQASSAGGVASCCRGRW